MENQGSLSKRGRHLEDEFFHRVDQKLADEIRAKMKAEAEKKELEKTCGFHDSQMLDDIVQLGVNTETIVGLSLVPLVRVAWADGIVDIRERAAVLKAAEESNCHPDSASYQLLSVWLDASPPPTLQTMPARSKKAAGGPSYAGAWSRHCVLCRVPRA